METGAVTPPGTSSTPVTRSHIPQKPHIPASPRLPHGHRELALSLPALRSPAGVGVKVKAKPGCHQESPRWGCPPQGPPPVTPLSPELRLQLRLWELQPHLWGSPGSTRIQNGLPCLWASLLMLHSIWEHISNLGHLLNLRVSQVSSH